MRPGGVVLEPGSKLLASLAIHMLALWLISFIEIEQSPEVELIEFEVAELPPEPKKPPPPPPKQPAPPPQEEPKEQETPKETPKPKLEPRTKSRPDPKPRPDPPAPEEPKAAPPIGPIDLPQDQTIGDSPVKVDPGGRPDGSDGGTAGGSPGGKPGGTGRGTNPGSGGSGKADTWAPKGDLYIAQQPRVVRVPEMNCPAVREMGISGTVVLEVQVRRDGSVRRARARKGIGNGCDEIAEKALRKAKFAPAVDTQGNATDYVLRYEYVFELGG